MGGREGLTNDQTPTFRGEPLPRHLSTVLTDRGAETAPTKLLKLWGAIRKLGHLGSELQKANLPSVSFLSVIALSLQPEWKRWPVWGGGRGGLLLGYCPASELPYWQGEALRFSCALVCRNEGWASSCMTSSQGKLDSWEQLTGKGWFLPCPSSLSCSVGGSHSLP